MKKIIKKIYKEYDSEGKLVKHIEETIEETEVYDTHQYPYWQYPKWEYKWECDSTTGTTACYLNTASHTTE